MLAEVEAKIGDSCKRAGRGRTDVHLVAVTKLRSIEMIYNLYDHDIRDFGESRVQELLKKKDELPHDIRWHFIGNLQSNKIKHIAPFVHLVHSIHSEGIAMELSRRAAEYGRTIPILVEVNISSESRKQGVEPEKVEELVVYFSQTCPNLILSGLMGMASFEVNPESTRPQFRRLRELRDKIRERHPELNSFKELSMGMSNDFEVAIEEGATIVRIGSALFKADQ